MNIMIMLMITDYLYSCSEMAINNKNTAFGDENETIKSADFLTQ